MRATTYKPEYCAALVEAAKAGKSIVWFCASIGTSRKVFYEWLKVHPELQEAHDLHRVYCQAWWEDAGQDGMNSGQLNATVWTKNMNNRFRDEWGEKLDVGLSGAVEVHKVKRVVVDQKAA